MSDDNAINEHKARAMGLQTGQGYGQLSHASGGAVHMAHKQHHVPTAGHHNMDGNITKEGHHHSHKSHGHHEGVHHTKTGSPVHGTGSGGAATGSHQSDEHGPSDNQFGGHMPSGKGSTLGRW